MDVVCRLCCSWARAGAARLRDAARRAACALRLALVLAASWLRAKTSSSSGAPAGHVPTPYRVYAFNEAPHDSGDGFFRELPVKYFSADTWEADVAAVTGWTTFRAEVRYMYRNKKYRIVLRRGDRLPPFDANDHVCRLPKGILSARLQGPVGSDIDCDVTSRVLKYQGPSCDFHAGKGLRVLLQDMFPFDDHADNAERFTHLRLVDVLGRIADLSYKNNPIVGLGHVAWTHAAASS